MHKGNTFAMCIFLHAKQQSKSKGKHQSQHLKSLPCHGIIPDQYNKITYIDYELVPLGSKDLRLITVMNFIVQQPVLLLSCYAVCGAPWIRFGIKRTEYFTKVYVKM